MKQSPLNPGYFGPPEHRKPDETQIPAPVGVACIHCSEQIAPADIGTVSPSGQVLHYECGLRAIVGSIGHQLGRCSCFGGNEEDPEGLTVREAAIAAARLWTERQRMPRFRIVRHTRMRAIECLDCGAVSYNANDLEHRYCGRCHKFHQQHDLYVGRLVEAVAGAQGLDKDDQVVDTGPAARGRIVAIIGEPCAWPYVVLFPAHGDLETLASEEELRDTTKYQLLED